jgi:hypothetical protein
MAEHKRIPGSVDPEAGMARTPVSNQQMREVRHYLARGRRFANLDQDALNDYWIAAYRELLHHRDLNHERDYDDLSAEFELRKLELPYEQVKHIFEADLAAARRQLEPEIFHWRELEIRVEALLVSTLVAYNKTNDDEQPLQEAS